MRSLAGHLLVASPRLSDGNFFRTVVLIIHHDEQGALGVVLNRPTDGTIREAWESISDDPCENDDALYVGGPVSGPLMALHTNEACSENEVLPGVYFSTHRDRLNDLVRKPQKLLRMFNGYSGWAPGQLERELRIGGWMVLPASSEHVFGDADTLWRLAAQQIGDQVIHPLMNNVPPPSDPTCN